MVRIAKITISAEVRFKLDELKAVGESYDALLRRLTGVQARPAHALRKYSELTALKPGESVTLLWVKAANGEQAADQQRLTAAVRRAARLTGRRFFWSGTSQGLLVTRVS